MAYSDYLCPVLATDGYKITHKGMFPEGTTQVYSNLTPRDSKHAQKSKLFDNKVVFFGLQAVLLNHLQKDWNDRFFHVDKEIAIEEIRSTFDAYAGPGVVDISAFEDLHDLGYLPIHIKALPEGSRVNIKVPVLTITNTHPEFFWLTNYLESILSAELHKGITAATTAYEFRRVVNHFAELTGANKDFTNWQCHDFSLRGMSGVNDAMLVGGAHLLSNYGSDTIPAISFLKNYYMAGSELISGSVPASEHSVMTMGGQDNEKETIRRIIKDIYPAGIVSVVVDGYDYWKVLTEYVPALKGDILSRQKNALGQAKTVFRPDSGDPVEIICGMKVYVLTRDEWDDARELNNDSYDVVYDPLEDKYYRFDVHCWPDGSVSGMDIEDEVPVHEVKGSIEVLWDTFGGTVTDKGFKVLDEHVGLIYGDSITLDRQWEILERLAAKGFASSNVVFGVGSYTYQCVSRDNFGIAVKATYGVVNGEAREIFKDPATDTNKTKKSAKGLLRVEKEGENFVLYDQQTPMQELQGELQTVFLDGTVSGLQSLAEIRIRLGAIS